MIFPNHIEAMEKAIAALTEEKPYAMLMAQMQSGKTTTYRLIACEMLRLGKVDHVIIFSGTNDTDLRDQTDPKNEPDEVIQEFNTEYVAYLTKDSVLTHKQIIEATGLIRKIKVCWGQDLDKHTRPGRTLYIWEESHYAQSQTQQVDLFNSRIGIDARGNAPEGCYVLSVSATGFSELAANHNFNQNKSVIKLNPGVGYVSVESQRPRIRPYNTSKLESILAKYTTPCYGVIRARDKEAEEIKSFKGWKIIEHDMKNKKDLNAILKKAPTEKTLILIKGMLRMGKVLIKTYIQFVVETGSKTDTILQGLLGRCCGYYKGLIDVYIKHLNWKELNAFIDLYNGNAESIPCKAMNVRKHGDRVPIIPLKIILDEDRVEKTRLWEDICQGEFHERDDDPFWNGNPANYVREIRRIIKTKCLEAHNGNRNHFVVHGTQKAIDTKTLKNIKESYDTKTPKCNFASAGAGACATEDEIVVWYSEREKVTLYISMQIKMGKVPDTTHREVFCKSPEPYINGGFKMDVSGNTRYSARQLESELAKFIQLSREHVTDKKITKNGSFKCIQLTPGVFKELPAIQERLRADGVELSWKKRSWTKADCTDVCLSEISWKLLSEAISEAVEVTIAEPIQFPVIDLDDDDTPLGMLVKGRW